MANTSIQLKKSGITGNTPSDLGLGELAINYADGKLYYKSDLNAIRYITNQDSFATIIANTVPIIATSTTDILSIQPDGGINVVADGISKTITIGVNESELTTFVRKSGDTMTGNLYLPSSNVEANTVIVDGKLYAGIAARVSTELPNVIAQLASNSASYVQVNQENIDPKGSADFVVTGDVGTDTDFFIDMGLLNSQYQPGSFNGLGTAGNPLDGYLVVQGSSIGQPGGNLVIGTVTTGTSGLNTKIVSGGSNTENIIVEFGETSAHVYKDLIVDGNISGPSITLLDTKSQNAYDVANGAFAQANAAFDKANTFLGANSFGIISTEGYSDILAPSSNSRLTFYAQTGIAIGTDPANSTISIATNLIGASNVIVDYGQVSETLGAVTFDYGYVS